MGGDAFPNTERVSEAEYQRVKKEVLNLLAAMDVQVGVPVEVSDKASLCLARGKDRPYGDVDFLVGLPEGRDREQVITDVRHLLGSEGRVIKNDSTHSFVTRERYQIDLQFCKPKNLSFLLGFKSNNDFGALLGHLLTPFKLKWSEAGLAMRLEVQGVAGRGTSKKDFLLSNNLQEVTTFLGLPDSCLDGVTRMSSREIFQVLTMARVFFEKDYNEKYKVRERKKRRPVSEAFFLLLEEEEGSLQDKKRKKYEGDLLEDLFNSFRTEKILFKEFSEKVAEHFGKGKEIIKAIETMRNFTELEIKSCSKFNFSVLKSWLPGWTDFRVGKVLQQLKVQHMGERKGVWEEWVQGASMEEIRGQVEVIVAGMGAEQK